MYYQEPTYLIDKIGNNALTFQERKKQGSDTRLYIPRLITGSLDDVRLSSDTISYEYVDENGVVVRSFGLERLVKIDFPGTDLYIIDNHNHAFAMWWRSYLSGSLQRGSYLIHIDQHSDYAEPENYLNDVFIDKDSRVLSQEHIDIYTNEILTIASFIKPALQIGLCRSHEMVLTEYKLLNEIGTSTLFNDLKQSSTIILDIDLDFRASEMSIQEYDKTITQVRKLISLPQVKCVTIATSPTYILQERALEILNDILG